MARFYSDENWRNDFNNEFDELVYNDTTSFACTDMSAGTALVPLGVGEKITISVDHAKPEVAQLHFPDGRTQEIPIDIYGRGNGKKTAMAVAQQMLCEDPRCLCRNFQLQDSPNSFGWKCLKCFQTLSLAYGVSLERAILQHLGITGCSGSRPFGYPANFRERSRQAQEVESRKRKSRR